MHDPGVQAHLSLVKLAQQLFSIRLIEGPVGGNNL